MERSQSSPAFRCQGRTSHKRVLLVRRSIDSEDRSLNGVESEGDVHAPSDRYVRSQHVRPFPTMGTRFETGAPESRRAPRPLPRRVRRVLCAIAGLSATSTDTLLAGALGPSRCRHERSRCERRFNRSTCCLRCPFAVLCRCSALHQSTPNRPRSLRSESVLAFLRSRSRSSVIAFRMTVWTAKLPCALSAANVSAPIVWRSMQNPWNSAVSRTTSDQLICSVRHFLPGPGPAIVLCTVRRSSSRLALSRCQNRSALEGMTESNDTVRTTDEAPRSGF